MMFFVSKTTCLQKVMFEEVPGTQKVAVKAPYLEDHLS